MTPTDASPPTADLRAAHDLIEQRAVLQQWLARLEELQSETPGHVAERVRNDYRDRLRSVTEQLGEHRDAIRADLDARLGRLEEARASLTGASDEREEARLRHRIGEIDDQRWAEREPELERALAEAERSAAEVEEEVARLRELLLAVEGPEPEPRSAVQAAEPTGGEFEDATLEGGDYDPPADAGEDLAFLEELDRAIAASMADAASPSAGGSSEEADSLRAPGVSPSTVFCRECGSENDAQAWYCEICGSELA